MISTEEISKRIVWLRGEKVLLDTDLADLYGVSTARLNEQVKRNAARFPLDFAFRLTNQELRNLISQIATSSSGHGGRRKNPLAFTEHGALMAAEVVAVHRALAAKLDALERKTEGLALKHDALAADSQAQFREVIEALRQLMSPPPPKRRPIGFITAK